MRKGDWTFLLHVSHFVSISLDLLTVIFRQHVCLPAVSRSPPLIALSAESVFCAGLDRDRVREQPSFPFLGATMAVDERTCHRKCLVGASLTRY
jgi:hypothetical protein